MIRNVFYKYGEVKKMNTIKVKSFESVDTTKYIEGSIFVDEKANAGILVGGVIKPITDGGLSRQQIQRMIDKAVKEVAKDVE